MMKQQYADHLITYENGDAGIRILTVSGSNPQIRLPEQIDGIPVTEIGRYCFSESLLTSIRLPSSIQTLHNCAFYNCRKLETFSCGPGIRGIGSDVFTNCSHLNMLIVRASAGLPTGLRLILERLPDDLTVSFQPDLSESKGYDPDQVEEARFFFPEYYEWLDEITPAHLFSRSIHGEGYRMRRCFSDRVLDTAKYDRCFEKALTSETDRSLCRIALSRLLHPWRLDPGFKKLYLSEAAKRISSCFTLAVEKQSMGLLKYICVTLSPDSDDLSNAYQIALGKEWGEGCAYLTAQRQQKTVARHYDIDWNL